MDIKQIEQVLAVATIGSINKAAPILYMTQSNLSQSIRKLEAECRHTIFIRTGAGVELTQFGIDFLRYAQDIMNRFQQLEMFCKDDLMPVTALSVSQHHLRFVTLAFIETYNKHVKEHTNYSIKETDFKSVCENVQRHESELGFLPVLYPDMHRMELMFKERGLLYTELATCPVGITFGENSPLSNTKGDCISLDQLRSYPLVLYADTLYIYTDSFSKYKMDQWPRLITVTDQATMNDILRRTSAFTVNASLNLYQKLPYYDGLKRLEISDADLMISVGYIQDAKTPLSSSAEDLLNIVHGMFA